jgi:HK97 family phage prohead protease
MPIQAFSLEIKSFSDSGQFQGYASVYNNVDLGGDVVMPGAFQKTLQDGGRNRPLLWSHRDPVGTVALTDTPAGLQADGALTLAVAKAAETYALMKDGVIRGLSIGYQTVREKFAGEVRQLLELKLFEVSLVTFPMNELATVSAVKERQQAEVLRFLRQLRADILGAYGKENL